MYTNSYWALFQLNSFTGWNWIEISVQFYSYPNKKCLDYCWSWSSVLMWKIDKPSHWHQQCQWKPSSIFNFKWCHRSIKLLSWSKVELLGAVSFGWQSNADKNSQVWQALVRTVDQQATGDQHLKPLDTFSVVSLWTDLVGNLCWHLAVKSPE